MDKDKLAYLKQIKETRIESCLANNASEMFYLIRRMIPWMGSFIANGYHSNCAMPNDAEQALQQAYDLCDKINKEVISG